jgi:hypothetical protein
LTLSWRIYASSLLPKAKRFNFSTWFMVVW